MLASSLRQCDVHSEGDDDLGLGQDQDEARKVQDMMDLLLPHISGATSLTIQTLYGDSLPSILHFSDSNCPNLHTLVLDSLLRGRGTPVPIPQSPNTPVSEILLPVVRNLALTGPNFVALLRSPPWAEWFGALYEQRQLGRFKKLRISHYRDSDGTPTSTHAEFTLEDFFCSFFMGCHHVGELVDISSSGYNINPDALETPTYDVITMERVSSSVVKSYLDCVSPFVPEEDPADFTHIFIGCDIGPSYVRSPDPRRDSIIHGESIKISHISNPDTLRVYLNLAADDVFGLWISDCPGFDDSVVRHLLMDTSEGRRPIPNLRALYIENCPQISLQVLRKAVTRLNYGCTGVDDEYIGISDWENSSDFGDMMDKFYDEIVHDESLNCPETHDTDPKTNPVVDYGDWERRMPNLEDDDPEDLDYYPPGFEDDQSVSDISESDEDLDSVILRYGPQIRLIRFSGASPKVTQGDIVWFEKKGVILEVL